MSCAFSIFITDLNLHYVPVSSFILTIKCWLYVHSPPYAALPSFNPFLFLCIQADDSPYLSRIPPAQARVRQQWYAHYTPCASVVSVIVLSSCHPSDGPRLIAYNVGNDTTVQYVYTQCAEEEDAFAVFPQRVRRTICFDPSRNRLIWLFRRSEPAGTRHWPERSCYGRNKKQHTKKATT